MLEFPSLHDWPKNPNDAVRIQNELRSRLIIDSGIEKLEYIAAVDTAFNEKNNRLFAAAIIMRYPELVDVDRAVAELEAAFPYIPALLAFREGPVILKAISRLRVRPDVIIFPRQGIAHPRGIGMASHLGLWTDITSVGCARKCLVGDYRTPGEAKGCCSSLFVSDREVGFVYRTKDNVKPMFITPGHKCSIRDAVDVVIKCLRDYRMPEPLRLAHLFAVKYKQSALRKMEQKRTVGEKTLESY